MQSGLICIPGSETSSRWSTTNRYDPNTATQLQVATVRNKINPARCPEKSEIATDSTRIAIRPWMRHLSQVMNKAREDFPKDYFPGRFCPTISSNLQPPPYGLSPCLLRKAISDELFN
jgi:hypothetical protein